MAPLKLTLLPNTRREHVLHSGLMLLRHGLRSSVAIPPLDTDSSPKTKPPTQNIGIVGKAAKGIRNGKAGRTTFSALDLPTPKCPEKQKK